MTERSELAIAIIDECVRINNLKPHSGSNLTTHKIVVNTLFNVRDLLKREAKP